MAFLTDACEYERPTPKNPKDEIAKLQRDYIEAAKSMQKIAGKLGL